VVTFHGKGSAGFQEDNLGGRRHSRCQQDEAYHGEDSLSHGERLA